jgi:hypothetical protein
MTETDPQYLARSCDGHECCNTQQRCENGVDDHLGFAQIVVKVAAQSVFFDHIDSVLIENGLDCTPETAIYAITLCHPQLQYGVMR